MGQPRRTFHVPPEFLLEMKKLQGKIKEITGEEPSLPKLANEIMHLPSFTELEKQIIKKLTGGESIIKFDR